MSPSLRHLPFFARFGLTLLVFVLVGGLAASLTHLIWHHENRDDQKGVSYTDIAGAYHGVSAQAPLMRAMEANHPPELPDAARQVLVNWLKSGRISEDYDNIDLGDNAPDAIIATNCVSCHNRNSADDVARKIPLEYFDDVRRLAFDKVIQPKDIKILAASTHTHALSLGSLSLVLGGMLMVTRFRGGFGALVLGISGLALFVDIGAWWLARDQEIWVRAIMISGPIYMATTGILCLLTVLDMWLPVRKKAE